MKFPRLLTDVNGLRYRLLRAPRRSGLANYPAVYSHKGREYTPCLEWVVAFDAGRKTVPVMLPFSP